MEVQGSSIAGRSGRWGLSIALLRCCIEACMKDGAGAELQELQ